MEATIVGPQHGVAAGPRARSGHERGDGRTSRARHWASDGRPEAANTSIRSRGPARSARARTLVPITSSSARTSPYGLWVTGLQKISLKISTSQSCPVVGSVTVQRAHSGAISSACTFQPRASKPTRRYGVTRPALWDGIAELGTVRARGRSVAPVGTTPTVCRRRGDFTRYDVPTLREHRTPGRTLQPHPPRRMGLPAVLTLEHRADRSPGRLPPHLQPSPLPHRTPRTPAHHPRQQRCGSIHLDRVLRGEADESLVAAQGCGESEKGQVVAGIALVAGAETTVAGQPGHRPLDDPPAAP